MSSPLHFSLLIVVPTLNSFVSLPRLLESLKAQTYPHWRLLFIDGPSSSQHRDWLQSCCEREARCNWVIQDVSKPGIFGAMNQGFAMAAPDEWLLFWGSDDWAAHPSVLAQVFSCIDSGSTLGHALDLLVCRGRYAHAKTGALVRSSVFQSSGLLNASAFRRLLLFGATPPHQATFFGPGARKRLAHYASGYRLSADLDYFLKLSISSDLFVQCIDLELVHMDAGGISGQHTLRRLVEVCRAYRRSFGWCWLFPFAARYARRLMSLVERNH